MKLPDELIFLANARKPQRTTTARLDGRRCVITGATSGVGYAAAQHLARGGAHLVLVCRNETKATRVSRELVEAYHAPGADVLLADFSDLAEVRAVARAILERYPALDILINNVGMHSTRRTLIATPARDMVDSVFYVNHLAPFLLTRLLLDRLRASAPARIIQVNSQGHRFGGLNLNDLAWRRRPYVGLFSYGASKVAQLHTVRELANRLAGSGVTINAMHPGMVKSNIGMGNGFLYRWYKRLVVDRFLKDTAIAGAAIYYLAAAPELEGVSGRYFNLTLDEPPASYTMKPALTQRVWEISERLTGLDNGSSV
jgi:NAD(P)-dependent dehydrogenase (short-subunit alcohol dehydrogenase family)